MVWSRSRPLFCSFFFPFSVTFTQKQFAVCFINEWCTVNVFTCLHVKKTLNPSLHIGKINIKCSFNQKYWFKIVFERAVDAMTQTLELNSVFIKNRLPVNIHWVPVRWWFITTGCGLRCCELCQTAFALNCRAFMAFALYLPKRHTKYPLGFHQPSVTSLCS